MPIYEIEAIVKVILQAKDFDEASEKAEENLGNVCSDVNITSIS